MKFNLATLRPALGTVLPAIDGPNLVDESNHRIANHLQLLMQMVSIEARRVENSDARAALDSTLYRIAAIAQIHRHLHRGQDHGQVNLGEYLGDLGAQLERGFSDNHRGRRICVVADPVMLEPRAITAIGMIVSELVSNACKHAYQPGEVGDILIALIAVADGYQLEVSDRGRGVGYGPATGREGLGVRLVLMMAQQLGGEAAWSDDHPGTRFVLRVTQEHA